MPQLAQAQYGKDNIRVYKVHKDEKAGTQDVTEFTVRVLLSGDIETSYTEADNSVVVATDTMKQTTYIFAKQHPVNPPELFASILANHFVTKYPHIHKAQVNVIQHRWARMTVEGKPHPHSFFRDGAETRNAEVVATDDKGIFVKSAIGGLLVLKSTGSQFHGFVKDEFAILKDVNDRILSTDVDSNWDWANFKTVGDVESAAPKFDKAYTTAREVTMRLFALENSPSVQNTMYKMCDEILTAVPELDAVSYSLPNKHYFEIDLSWHKDLKNTGENAEVYAPQSDPNGLIQCTVTR